MARAKKQKKDDPWTKKYPDSVDGVLQMMRDNSGIPADVLAQAEVYPDPQVSGVWKLEWSPTLEGYKAAVAYLAGYSDPYGDVREENDFEVEEEFEDDLDLDRMSAYGKHDRWGDDFDMD